MPSSTAATTTHIDINSGCVAPLKIPIVTKNSKEIQDEAEENYEEVENQKRYISEMPPVVVSNVAETISVTNTTPEVSPTLVRAQKKDTEEENFFCRPSQMKEHGELNGFSEEEDATTTTMKVEPSGTASSYTSSVAQSHTIISVGSDAGVDADESSCISCVLPSPSSGSTTTSAVYSSPVSQIEIVNHSRGGVADCASALTESVSSTEKDFHVVKIKISPDSESFSESVVNPHQQQRQQQKFESEIKSDPNLSVVGKKVTVVNLTSVGVPPENRLELDIGKDISEGSDAMVQKSNNSGTSVTELNVSNPTYLYYMMTSGQFSPSDTLDSGTCSDMDNGGSTTNSTTPPPLPKKVGPKLEMHLKTTKILMKDDPHGHHHRPRKLHHDHQRAGSLTDSEESESSLSCDSLSLSDGLPSKLSFLPDSLLRDIRDRKFPNSPPPPPPTGGSFSAKIEFNYADNDDNNDQLLVSERNKANAAKFENTYRKDNNKSCVIIKEGTYGNKCGIDDSMEARKFENDKFYTFHVNEHDFGSLVESEPKSLSDDAFAGYRDIRSPSSGTSTIRSSKGTVRGVKNRVRNGIATFLQLQQSNVKNYKEKDIGKVVLYTTSMGIIRETYAKCSNMKQILRTLLVKFEERDVFMSTEYQQEIKERMHSDEIKVPQLFVEGQHIGDAEHVERLNESGELRQLLKPYKSISSTYTCQICGGYRLLPCPSCNGSKKSVHRNHFTAEFVALKCMNCDEVGLVKCHNC